MLPRKNGHFANRGADELFITLQGLGETRTKFKLLPLRISLFCIAPESRECSIERRVMSPSFPYASLDDWIAREVIPFSLNSHEHFNAAVDKLMLALGDSVELLGLGEPLHGGEEILVLRNRFFERLVEKHGYTAIAIESSFPKGRLVNEYIAGRCSISFKEVRDTGFSHGFGHLDTTRELVEWMRFYNADPAHQGKLHFYGFDAPTEMMVTDSPRRLLHFVLDYLDSIDGATETARRQRIDLLLGKDADWENPAVAMDPTKSIGLSPAANALRLEAEEVINELAIRRPELITKSGADRYSEVAQHASETRQLLNYHAGLARASNDRVATLLGIRDAMMADNLSYAVARERGRGKVLAFAHNAHLQRRKAQLQFGLDVHKWWPAGAQLDQILGPGYAVIGSGVGTSDANGITPPAAGTLESQLNGAGESGTFIPTRKGKGLPTSEISALPARSVSAKNPSYMVLGAESFTDFDAFAVLNFMGLARGDCEWLPKS